jgi:hypothetical protein
MRYVTMGAIRAALNCGSCGATTQQKQKYEWLSKHTEHHRWWSSPPTDTNYKWDPNSIVYYTLRYTKHYSTLKLYNNFEWAKTRFELALSWRAPALCSVFIIDCIITSNTSWIKYIKVLVMYTRSSNNMFEKLVLCGSYHLSERLRSDVLF